MLTVSAVPSPGFVFDHWEGSLSGNANPVTLTMDSDKSVTAFFVRSDARYGISAFSTAGGSVDLLPLQPPDRYLVNQLVALTASAQSGYSFSHWEGSLSGTTNPSSVLMDRSKSVTAVFDARVQLLQQPPNSGDIQLEPLPLPSGYPLLTFPRN